MKIKTKKTFSRKKTFLFVMVGLVLVIGAAIYVQYALKATPRTFDTTKQGVNLERSVSEKAAESALKQNPEQKLENNQSDTPQLPTQPSQSGKIKVNVVLTNAENRKDVINAGGMITDIVESTGVCTYTFSSQGTTVTKTSSTLVNPTSTTCKSISFSAEELSNKGSWTVQLSYASDAYEGTSNEKEIIK